MAQTIERDLLPMFVDKGDELLGHALETSEGREAYGMISGTVLSREILGKVFREASFKVATIYGDNHLISFDGIEVLALQMIKKAVDDFIREQLKA